MRAPTKAIAGALLLPALVLAGCGGGTSTVTRIAFRSTAVRANTMSARYTCDGRNVPPPLEWGAVPARVKHLALFVVGYTPEPATHTNKVSIEWAVAGLNPGLHRLVAGKKLPPGAFLGLNSNGKPGYSICPAKGTLVQYQFELYGLPPSIEIQPRFAAVEVISALTAANSSTPESAYGAFIAAYKR